MACWQAFSEEGNVPALPRLVAHRAAERFVPGTFRLSLQDSPDLLAESSLRIGDQDPHGIPGPASI